jgi:hypothetical protein
VQGDNLEAQLSRGDLRRIAARTTRPMGRVTRTS